MHKELNSSKMSTKVIQVTNIAPQATKDQMQNLFGCIGKIDEIRLYPTVRDVTCPVLSRICYVKFFESSCVAVAQHLTNTVFIDRALIVCPVSSGYIPDEFKALEITNNGAAVPGLHTPDSYLPPEVSNRIDGSHPYQVIKTSDPKLDEWSLPEYPALPINTDARKIEEIRRTIIVFDVPADWELEEIISYFSHAGEVKYARFAEKNRQKHVMLEFCEQKSIVEALKLQGSELHGKPLNIYHSMQAIIKPEAKSNEAAQREIEEAMSIVKEAQNMISAAIDPVIGILAKETSVSRRRSRSRSRSSRSRSRSKRSRSRKHSRRSRSRSRSKRKRSRSRSRRRSNSRSRRKSSSRSRSKRSRSKDRERRKRSRSRRRSRSGSSRRRSRTRSRERRRSRSPQSSRKRKEEKRSRRSRSRSNSRAPRHSKDRASNAKETPPTTSSKQREKDRGRDDRDRERDRDRDRERERERDKDRDRDRERDRDKGKDRERTKEREKPRVREYEHERSRSKETSRKPKRERDYDAEEKIGMEESKRDSTESREPSPEKSDNMDISNSP